MPGPGFAQDFRQLDAARCTSGQLSPTNNGAAAVFNISSQYIVRVWGIALTISANFNTRYTQTRLANQAAGTVAPLMPGEPTTTVAVDTDDLVGAGTSDFNWVLGTAGTTQYFAPYPFALLRPGWGFLLVKTTAAGNPNYSFLVDWVYPSDLYFHRIGDIDLDRKV